MSTPHIIPSSAAPTADASAADSGDGPRRGGGAPTGRRRIVGVDVARGLALVGMFGAHLMVASGPDLTLTDPSTWLDIVNGRSSILFALLAGVSLALMTGGARTASPDELRKIRLRLVGRGAAIFVIGLVVELLGSGIAVILTLYGVLYILAAFTVHLRTRVLVIAGAALAILGPPLLALIGTLAGSGRPGAVAGAVRHLPDHGLGRAALRRPRHRAPRPDQGEDGGRDARLRRADRDRRLRAGRAPHAAAARRRVVELDVRFGFGFGFDGHDPRGRGRRLRTDMPDQ